MINVSSMNCRNVPYVSLNICKRHLNSETLNPVGGWMHFCMLFTKEDKGLLLTKVQILGPDHTDELDNSYGPRGEQIYFECEK